MNILRPLILLFLLTTTLTAFAFSDVPSNAWYAETLDTFVAEGHLDHGVLFRPSENALRGEFVDLLLKIQGDTPVTLSPISHFDDVPSSDPLYETFQDAAARGWVRGAGGCIGQDECFAFPQSPINRAEAAALLNRAFELEERGDAPSFEDTGKGSWYDVPIQAAADHCVLKGDDAVDGMRRVRPEAYMNRAEMIVMLDRSRQSLQYGKDCGVETTENTERLRPPRVEGPDEVTDFTGEQNLPDPQTPTGVALMRFDMTAHPVQDTIIRSLKFEAEQGSLLNAEDYSLWVDHDRDGTVETLLEGGAGPKSDFVTFQNLFGGAGYIVTEQTVMFEVRATIAGPNEGSTLQLKMADNGIEAEELDGEQLAEKYISTNTTPAKVFTILNHGNLYVTEGAVPERSHQLLGGTATDTLLRLTFKATEEDIEVVNLRISSSGSTATSVDRLELLHENSSAPFATATVGGCGSDDVLTTNPIDGSAVQTFCVSLSGESLLIPEDARVDVFVRARMKTDEEGGPSGEKVQLWLTKTAVNESISGSGSVRARGYDSSEILSANDGDSEEEGELFIGTSTQSPNADIVGSEHLSILAQVVTVRNGSTDANESPIQSGESTLGAFLFTAAANANTANGTNNVVLEDVIFSVNATNVELDAASFVIFSTENPLLEETCTALDTDGNVLAGTIMGSILVRCTGLTSSLVPTSINASETMIVGLKGNVTDPIADDGGASVLRVSLQSTFTPMTSFGVGASHIHWLDTDSGGSTDHYWIDLPFTEMQSTLYKL